MRTVGLITTAVGVAVAYALGALVVRSMPDIRRYLAIRRM
jgi:hypothetical protein